LLELKNAGHTPAFFNLNKMRTTEPIERAPVMERPRGDSTEVPPQFSNVPFTSNEIVNGGATSSLALPG
jgi:hypothetical protein